MKQAPIRFQQGNLDLNQPQETIKLKRQSLHLTDLTFTSSNENTRSFFWNPAHPATGSLAAHQFVCCSKELIKVYSISQSKGINLESIIPVKKPPEVKGRDNNYEPKREFIRRSRANKITLLTKTWINYYDISLSFQEVDLRDPSKNKDFYPLQPYQTRCERIESLLLTNTRSHRVYIQNCLLRIKGLEVTQTYITSNLKVRKPNTLLKIKHDNAKKIFFSQVRKLKAKQRQAYGKILSINASEIHLTEEHRFNYSHNNNFTTKDVNQRLYYIKHDLLEFVTISNFMISSASGSSR